MKTRLPKDVTAVKAGKTMKKLREDMGLSQKELAPFLGITRDRLGNYEIDRYPVTGSALLLATIAADKIARAEYFKKLDEAVKAAKESAANGRRAP